MKTDALGSPPQRGASKVKNTFIASTISSSFPSQTMKSQKTMRFSKNKINKIHAKLPGGFGPWAYGHYECGQNGQHCCRVGALLAAECRRHEYKRSASAAVQLQQLVYCLRISNLPSS
jgi:hypothetical protein